MTPNKPVQPTPLRGAADLALWALNVKLTLYSTTGSR
jgi:hypothetical protein